MPKIYVYQRAEDLGLPVVDGGAPVIVTVTATDVIKAKKADSKSCAFSRAALRVPGVNAAYFFRCTAFLEYANRMVRYSLPISAQKEICSFDRAQIFAPGLYQLTPPCKSRDPKETAKYRRKRKKSIIAKTRAIRNELDGSIRKIAAQEPANDTPEQREFDQRVRGIIGPTAPTPLKERKAHHHRTQYVRDMREPEQVG